MSLQLTMYYRRKYSIQWRENRRGWECTSHESPPNARVAFRGSEYTAKPRLSILSENQDVGWVNCPLIYTF